MDGIRQTTRSTATRDGIAEALRALGVWPGDVLLVHSSLSSFGRVDGGPDAVIDALLDVLGPDGLLVMPTFTNCRVAPATTSPAEPYDPATTSCRDRTGIIPDTFRRRNGVKRSLHPTHSVAACGPRADEFVAGGERRTFDPAGPFGRFVRWNGKALFLGARLGANTTMHVAEDWMGLPFLTREKARVQTESGPAEVVVTGQPSGCRSYYGGGGVVADVFERAGIIRQVSLNETVLRLLSAREIIRVTCEHESASRALSSAAKRRTISAGTDWP